MGKEEWVFIFAIVTIVCICVGGMVTCQVVSETEKTKRTEVSAEFKCQNLCKATVR